MNITIFGANGRVGSLVVAELLDRGHEVTAFIHGPSRLPEHPSLHLVRGDIHSDKDVREALRLSQVVISTLGSWGTKSKDILTAGMQRIIPAMQEANIKRIVSLTGAGAFDAADAPRWFDKLNRFILSLVAPKILKDGEDHIALLRASGLNWMVVRSPIMRESDKRGYTLSGVAPLPWDTIHRHDVVDAIVQLALSNDRVASAPFITKNK